MSLATGLYPSIHMVGEGDATGIGIAQLNPMTKTIASLLKQKGYKTIFISDHLQPFYIHNFSDNFDRFIKAGENNPGQLTQAAIKVLSEGRRKPLFLWLHYFGPHLPYYPSDKHLFKIPIKQPDKTVPLATKYSQIFGVIPLYAQIKEKNNLNFYLDSYDGKIRFTDRYLGKLFEQLTKKQLFNDSLIIITSDHGQAFGEHNLYCNHIYSVYNTLLSVPLLIKLPGNYYSNKTINQNTAIIDLAPTILEITNTKSPYPLHGKSLLRLIDNKPDNDPRVRPIFANGLLSTTVFYRNYKLIRRDLALIPTDAQNVEYELYKIKQDPYEENNIIGDLRYTLVGNRLKQEIIKYKLKDPGIFKTNFLEGWRDNKLKSKKEAEQELNAMRGLGYLQ
jgi:arylsulfatase A-like enzyme